MYCLSMSTSMHFLIMLILGLNLALDWLITYTHTAKWSTSCKHIWECFILLLVITVQLQIRHNFAASGSCIVFLHWTLISSLTSWMRALCRSTLRAFMILTIAACKYIFRSSSTALLVCSISWQWHRSVRHIFVSKAKIILATTLQSSAWPVVYLSALRL